MIITLEGNIGAGKTTLAKALCEDIAGRGKRVVHLTEPVDAWSNFYDADLLKLFYADKRRWSFTFQVNALLQMTDIDKRATDLSRDGYFVIKERSSFSVRHLFVPLLKQYMTRAEFQILTELCNKIEDPRISAAGEAIADITLYLRTDPDICYKRIMRRNRAAETGRNGGIDIHYLKQLHDQHESAQFIGKTYIVSGDDFDTSVFFFAQDKGGADAMIDFIKSMNIGSASPKEKEDNLSSTTRTAAKAFMDNLMTS